MKKFTNALMLGAISIATLVAMNSCDKTPSMTIDPASVELHYGDTIIMTANNAPAEVTYESSNNYVAIVSGDTLFSVCIGEAAVTATSGDQKATCAVKVVPQYTFAKEPVTEWGISLVELKELRGSDCEVSGNTALYTQDEERVIMEMYIFQDEKLVCSMLAMPEGIEGNENILYFLAERYLFAGIDERGVYYFANAFELEDITTIVTLGVVVTEGGRFYRADYMPYTQQEANIPALKIQKHKANLPALH